MSNGSWCLLLLFGDFSHLLSGTEALQADTKMYTKLKSISLDSKLNLQLPRLKGVFEQPFVAGFCQGMF